MQNTASREREETLLLECLGQTNTDDGGKVGISGFSIASIKLYTENMDSNLYCSLLQNELKQSMAKISNKTKIIFQQELAPWRTSNIVKDRIAKMKL